MTFDNILANPPYARIGCDITKKVIEQNPNANYAMLGTRSMFKPFYADTLACQFVQIGKYELGSNQKLDCGVEQAILLATNGWTEVVDNRKKGNNVVQMSQGQIPQEAYTRLRSTHLVGVNELWASHTGSMGRSRTATLVQVNKPGPYLGEAMDRNTADVKLRNGYIYVSFETFEEACECAIDMISWTNPTDSHYRCVKWGFVTGLVSHERYKEEGEQK